MEESYRVWDAGFEGTDMTLKPGGGPAGMPATEGGLGMPGSLASSPSVSPLSLRNFLRCSARVEGFFG